jgi:hypothetical protein
MVTSGGGDGVTEFESLTYALRANSDLLMSACSLLEEILTELRHGNSSERTGAVSSLKVEGNPTRELKVRVTTHHYVGSPLTPETIGEQLDAHALAHREAERRAMNGWSETLVDAWLRPEKVS